MTGVGDQSGAANLIYTFTRSGSTVAAATVNFRVTGSAFYASDFTATGAASIDAKVGTVTFAAGSATAQVTVDPTADTTVELDEPAWLSVLPGATSAVDAPGRASGTILTDDTVQVAQTTINDGSSQRSIVTRVNVTFNAVVDVTSQAFRVVNRATQQAIGFTVTTSIVNGKTVATLTFVAGASVYRRGTGYCLVDGNYGLTVFSDEVSFSGQHLDGNKDGVAGDDYSFGTTAAEKFFRMFGDNDGDRDVDPTDFAFFRRTYGKIQGNTGFNAVFDYDGDGDVDLTDFAYFRRNWGKTLPLP